MLVETLSIIASGVFIVEGVIGILKNAQENASNDDLETSIEKISQRVALVESELNKPKVDDANLLSAYTDLIKALQQDRNHLSYIRIVPTDYGTWKIARKTKRKKTILRDPNGEY